MHDLIVDDYTLNGTNSQNVDGVAEQYVSGLITGCANLAEVTGSIVVSSIEDRFS